MTVRTRRWRPATLAVAALASLTLTACGGGSSSAAKPSAAASPNPSVSLAPGQDHLDTEGSITTPDGRFVQYPDGLIATVTEVKDITAEAVAAYPDNFTGDRACNGGCEDNDSSKHSYIRITVKVENEGSDTIILGSSVSALSDVFYGENRTPAQEQAGIAGSTLFDSDPQPTQLKPGTSFAFIRSYTVPKDYGKLAAAFNVEAFPVKGAVGRTPYTWTDLESALTAVPSGAPAAGAPLTKEQAGAKYLALVNASNVALGAFTNYVMGIKGRATPAQLAEAGRLAGVEADTLRAFSLGMQQIAWPTDVQPTVDAVVKEVTSEQSGWRHLSLATTSNEDFRAAEQALSASHGEAELLRQKLGLPEIPTS